MGIEAGWDEPGDIEPDGPLAVHGDAHRATDDSSDVGPAGLADDGDHRAPVAPLAEDPVFSESRAEGALGAYPDESIRPSAQEIAAARATLAAAGLDSNVVKPDGLSDEGASDLSANDLKQLDEEMKETAETAALLSNIASIRHNTAMGIIGNIR